MKEKRVDKEAGNAASHQDDDGDGNEAETANGAESGSVPDGDAEECEAKKVQDEETKQKEIVSLACPHTVSGPSLTLLIADAGPRIHRRSEAA